MTVGSYLRTARERRRLTLDEVSERTKIKPALLVDLENNDVSRWPRQRLYRHGYLRAYARAVGLDPGVVLARFDAEFGDPHPVAFHGRPKKPARPLPFAAARYGVLAASVAILAGALVGMPGEDQDENAVTAMRAVVPRISSNQLDPPTMPVDPTAAPSTNLVAEAADAQQADVEGELLITSRPAHAHVTVNGIARGATPLRVRYLPLGSYTVRVIHPGYKIRETRVTLRAEQPSRTVRVLLRDAPRVVTAALHAFGTSLQ